ncbi:T9SS type B sorting domain-containing protein [Flavobacterium jejuense]|uniref:T9SS type B sorting domain-containing protein n=1 Tax=Flavobacterium jejuense TaxID=1544455 RepID=A0ABX0J0Q8_9FLAO|nr:gliding motility-associated C-terminal domain-containing protein [Flavobacterium jejuense]NHN27579.1 T9SS type B sorting domain-containing protein [Flavobacterium jejuense]
MKQKKYFYIYFAIILFPLFLNGQDISLYTQINGRYDFTFIGNTMNSAENNITAGLVTGTSSTANLNLNSNDTVIKAFLYWSGSGDGDFEVDLNGIPITPDRTFNHSRISGNNQTFTYFSAFKDITTYIQNNGNGDYTLSNLDISAFEVYHKQISTNYSGWAILIVYENSNLPLNQINVYDGLQGVPSNLSINLTNLFVIDNNNATAGFIAWEGDASLPTETFAINGTVISNGSNPINNVFNGTNSITGATDLYNMDLDIYDIENYIQIGNTSANITLSSFQDFIMINTVVTKLNSQLPDATIVIDDYDLTCNNREIPINYTVYNVNSTEILQANTPIAFYVEGVLVGASQTQNIIPIGNNETGSTVITIPNSISQNFTLTAVVDDIGNGNGIVTELVETNNSNTIGIKLLISPEFNILEPLLSCNLGLTKAIFDFSDYEQQVKIAISQIVTFYENYDDAENEQDPIFNTSNYEATSTPKEIFIRIENEYNCYSITSFLLKVKNCPPIVYNAVSPNNDNLNDSFFIDGLRDIFINFRLEIYNRWGKLLWIGNNDKPDWNGYVEEGIGSKLAPDGTYFYILYLNDPSYPEPLNGYLYLDK